MNLVTNHRAKGLLFTVGSLLALESCFYFRMSIFNYKIFKVMAPDGNLSPNSWLIVTSTVVLALLHIRLGFSYAKNSLTRKIIGYLGLPLAIYGGWAFLKIAGRVTDWTGAFRGDVVSLSALSSLGYFAIGTLGLITYFFVLKRSAGNP